ncbi:Hypothetical_protein [Hexamita inflata]|uniref:Hypothetical_protein n=1 Tax=Hexamita inflata TaxID=28002 RepID=A0AA86TR29_9EUKA|nr:Hypothetical protein HINF_LOCUS7518 [Hexamita inflata]
MSWQRSVTRKCYFYNHSTTIWQLSVWKYLGSYSRHQRSSINYSVIHNIRYVYPFPDYRLSQNIYGKQITKLLSPKASQIKYSFAKPTSIWEYNQWMITRRKQIFLGFNKTQKSYRNDKVSELSKQVHSHSIRSSQQTLRFYFDYNLKSESQHFSRDNRVSFPLHKIIVINNQAYSTKAGFWRIIFFTYDNRVYLHQNQ